MIGKLTLEKASMNMSYFLASMRILADAGLKMAREDFIASMSTFMGCSATLADGKENRVPYNKTKFPRYFGFIDVDDDGSLFITARGRRLLPLIEATENANADERYSLSVSGRGVVSELFFESIVFDTFGKNNCGAEQSKSDIEPPKVILKALSELGSASKHELGYVLWGLDCDEFSSFSDALDKVKANRNIPGFSYVDTLSSWGKLNIVNDFKLVDLLAKDEIDLIEKRSSDDNYQISSSLTDKARARIASLNAFSTPLQLLVRGNSSNTKTEAWVLNGILGRYGDQSQVFVYNPKCASIDEWTKFLGNALIKAYDNPRRNVSIVIPRLTKEVYDVTLLHLQDLFERNCDFKSTSHGCSVKSAEILGLHDYILEQQPALSTALPSVGINLPSNLNLIGVIDMNTQIDTLPNVIHFTNIFVDCKSTTCSGLSNTSPRQLIIYGAPGTGKSWRIKNDTHGMSVIRTTFHPDSDYSTFVGAYKPSMEDDDFKTVVMTGEIGSAGNITKKDGLVTKKHVVYSFRAQAFLDAYIAAWRKCAAFLSAQDDNARNAATQFLVIEEINRGNCAQIFGDIFQLLDREDDGYSSYAINADNDLSKFVADSFKGDTAKGIPALDLTGVDLGDRDITPAEIAAGDKLLLPPNLYIWATMNTSDQSLFPIDSAFKRRWAWKYIPISNANKNYTIEVGCDKYEWWTFLEKANALVEGFTESEDKKLGYFFCKADNSGVISLEQFVGKVVFYLWNGIFKDTGFDDEVFDDGNGDKLYFKRFFGSKGDPDPAIVKKLMENLGVPAVGSQQTGTPPETQTGTATAQQ